MRRVFLAGCLSMTVVVLATAIALAATHKGRNLVALLVQIVTTDDLGDNPLGSTEDLVRYLEAHPDRYALAAWDVGHEDAGLFHDADTRWPLASTVKLVPLVLASEALADGRWQAEAPLPDVERFYLPGTDGDAHLHANAVDGGTGTVGGALHGMIRFSDNAATDALLFKLGRTELAARAEGLPTPHPLSGTTLLGAEGFDGGAEALDDAAWARAERLRTEPASDFELPSFEAQEAMTRRLDNRGSPRAFARLIESVFTDPSPRTAVARAELAWPMEFAANQRDFVRLATKGGSLPGVLTSATWGETHAGQRRVVALFLHDLPARAWLTLAQNYVQQDLERELLLDPGALERLRPRLGK